MGVDIQLHHAALVIRQLVVAGFASRGGGWAVARASSGAPPAAVRLVTDATVSSRASAAFAAGQPRTRAG